MLLPPFAAGIGIGAEGVAAVVVKALAVGGGFLVGYFLGAAIAWALDRWVFAHKAPPQLKKVVSILAGLALAILVALIVFGEGGHGLFGNGGGDGKGTPTPAENGKETKVPERAPKTEQPPKEPPSKPPEIKPTPGDVRVAILGGSAVHDGRFYLLDNDTMPKTFEEFKDAINNKRKISKTEITLVFRFKGAELSPTHPEMKKLTAWLQEAKILNRFE